jgi:diguanylate cyclase (GGDEF)-like protein
MATKLNIRKIELLHDQAFTAFTAATAAAALLILIFWRIVPHDFIILWIVGFVIVTFSRYVEVYLFKKHRQTIDNFQIWRLFYDVGTFIAGLLWCYLCIFLLNHTNSLYSGIVVFTISGLSAGAMATYVGNFRTYMMFATPSTLLMVIYLLLQTENEQYIDMGYILLLFYFFLFFSARHFNVFIENSIQQTLTYEQLVIELQEEVSLRQAAEKKLISEKEKAESIAEDMFQLSTTDGLTGIENRRMFDGSIQSEWSRAIRYKKPLSLILCDIDFFKRYNDHYGHQEGDICLQNIAKVLREHARRGGDIAARYGGEEFAVIMPDTDEDNAEKLAIQMHDAISELKIPHEASQISDIVTASFGVASTIPTREQTYNRLIKYADISLYKAKTMGRDQVIVADITEKESN